jgi:hypothetical protein
MSKVFKTRGVYLALSIAAVVCVALIIAACGEDSSPTAPQTATTTADAGTSASGGKNDDKGKQDKLIICHVDGKGRYRPIEVSGNAAPAHFDHGDAAVGAEVPTEPGLVFNDECVPSIISIDVEKATNGHDADDAPGPGIRVGQDVDWTYEVANTGEVPVINVAVTDDQGVAVTCPETELAAGTSMTCTASGSAVAGQYENLGTADATSVADFPVSDDDPSHYFGEDPSIDIEKSTNGRGADSPPGPTINPGNPVEWTYVVTNTGNVKLVDVTVVDDQGVTVTCPQDTLEPGESMTCTASGTAVPGQYANIGTATGDPPHGPDVTDSDASHYISGNAGIDLEKSTNGADADQAPGPEIPEGDPVVWEYAVTNTGDIPLSAIRVEDDQGVVVSCPKDTLAVGESMVCTAAGTAISGPYSNIGTAIGAVEGGDEVSDSDPSHYFGRSAQAGIRLEKLTNGEDADSAPGPEILKGSAVNWTYVVSNTGNSMLTGISVSDDQGVRVRCPASVLAVGASMTCTGGGTAIEGQYSNLGTVTATTPEGATLSDDDPSHYIGVTTPGADVPSIDIEKSTNGFDADEAPGPALEVGDAVTWTYRVTNSGNTDLINVVVTDDQGVPVICPKTTLAQGESMTCTGNGIAVAGQYRNVGRATASTTDGTPVEESDPSHYNAGDAFVTIEKSTNGNDADSPPGPTIPVGDPITWTYVVTNTGEVPLANVSVTDDSGVSVSCPGTTLAVGQSMTCVATGTAAEGQQSNIGTVMAVSPGGRDVSDTDPSHYVGQSGQPAIKIEKATNGQDADLAPGPTVAAGDSLTWTYLVSNSGNTALVDVTVVDDQGVSVICPPEFVRPDPTTGFLTVLLNPGESMICTGNGVATLGQYQNIGTAAGKTALSGGVTVSASDPSHYIGKTLQENPGIDLEKATNGFDADQGPGPTIAPGSPVIWTYVVTNTGDVVLTNVRVLDNQEGDITCPTTVLNPGESMTCTASGIAIAGQYSNMGIALGEPPSGRSVEDRDPSSYFGGLEDNPEPDPSETS